MLQKSHDLLEEDKSLMAQREKRVVIWGTKLEAEKILFKCKMKHILCSYVIDNYAEGRFHGYKIKKFSDIQSIAGLCIVACSSFETYKNIKMLLLERGYVEFENLKINNVETIKNIEHCKKVIGI